MTRINLVDPERLCDQHLLAEHREITRIPNCINKGRYSLEGIPSEYVLGKGHVKFFYNKLAWLKERHSRLHAECLRRGFSVKNIWPESTPEKLNGDYNLTNKALFANIERIQNRMPVNARYCGVGV